MLDLGGWRRRWPVSAALLAVIALAWPILLGPAAGASQRVHG